MPTLKEKLPWTRSPLIINAPLAGVAGGNLASAVTLAGGLGLIGAQLDMDDARKELRLASEAFASDPLHSASTTLPVGIGFLIFEVRLEDVLPVVEEYKPVVVWLFAAKELSHYAEWAAAIRKVSPQSSVWVQVGSVTAAVQVAKTANPDVLCLQGADAGGHGFEKGASIISLLPEASDTLASEGFSNISLVAAGGIVDGRGVTAALSLGAEGVVMGTRFLASNEVNIHPMYQAAVLEAKDGGQATTRSKVFNQLGGPNTWPEMYDGRSLRVESYKDFADGVSVEISQRLHNEAVSLDDKGFRTELEGRAVVWAGTGVGLVNKVSGAAEIVASVRSEARKLCLRQRIDELWNTDKP